MKAKLRAAIEGGSLQSIETATNLIAYLYGVARTQSLDVDQFIRDFSNRPIATMEEILGSPDLTVPLGTSGEILPDQVKGTLGFHSMAVYEPAVRRGNLAGLSDDP